MARGGFCSEWTFEVLVLGLSLCTHQHRLSEMSLRLKLFQLINAVNRWRRRLLRWLDGLGIVAAVAGFLLLLYHIGFDHNEAQILLIQRGYNIVLGLILVSNLAGLTLSTWRVKVWKLRLAELIMIPLVFLLLDQRINFSGFNWLPGAAGSFLLRDIAVQLIIVFVLLVEISTSSLRLSNRNSNPARLFIGSFLLLIVFGAGLLMLPNATYSGISFTDAFFIATSAVCVTGLIVVDTATYFTPLGKGFILILIQLGGLGIMTFTSFFGYFFKGGSSFGNEFLLKELLNEDKLGEIFRTLGKIILITFSIEAIGAVLIYQSLDQFQDGNPVGQIAFSVFHSVSAFCNAGFSLLGNNLFEEGFRFNYNMQLVIALLIIAGGLGFPIVFNYYRLFRYYLVNRLRQLVYKKPYEHLPGIINVNSRLVLITTLCLLAGGFLLFFLLEYNYSLQGLSLQGKLTGAFFSSVTARTAGFNTTDLTAMAPASVLIMIFLMWVGASPASTGGGIKTTTFSVALLNVLSLARGKDRIELKGREITNASVRRASAVIWLSLLVNGLAVFLLQLTDGHLGMKNLVFETFSAYGTVGLSLGITSHLSTPGRWIIIVVMFLGRVGTLTLIIGFFRKVRSLHYRYPAENIMIN